MTAATITSKGRITIPARVRQSLQVEPGDRVEFVEVAPGRFELMAANENSKQSSASRSVTALKGMFRKRVPAIAIEKRQNC